MPGPAKKPTKLKILHGTDRPCRTVNEPEPPPADEALLKTPAGLPKEAQKLWRQLAPELHRLGLLTEVDTTALLLTCVHAGVAIEAAKMLRQEGITRQDENNVTRKHPAYQLVRDATGQFWRGAARFGLTPADRAALNVPDENEAYNLAAELRKAIGE